MLRRRLAVLPEWLPLRQGTRRLEFAEGRSD
jgi:hypothetical protein